MPWSVSARLAAVALAAASFTGAAGAAGQERAMDVPLPPEAGDASGPAGTSGMGASRYDQVGVASVISSGPAAPNEAAPPAKAAGPITGAHRHIRPGSVAEVTALDTGRTILVLVDRVADPGGPTSEIALSPRAAAMLGLTSAGNAAVRVRSTVASATDLAALRAGRPAASRLDAPPALLAALREQLAPAPRSRASDAEPPPPAAPRSARVTARVTAAPAPSVKRSTPAPQERASGRYLVQVAALSHAARARDLARTLGGHVESTGQIHRIRLGPFADAISAQRARDAARRRGYGDATILTQP